MGCSGGLVTALAWPLPAAASSRPTLPAHPAPAPPPPPPPAPARLAQLCPLRASRTKPVFWTRLGWLHLGATRL